VLGQGGGVYTTPVFFHDSYNREGCAEMAGDGVSPSSRPIPPHCTTDFKLPHMEAGLVRRVTRVYHMYSVLRTNVVVADSSTGTQETSICSRIAKACPPPFSPHCRSSPHLTGVGASNDSPSLSRFAYTPRSATYAWEYPLIVALIVHGVPIPIETRNIPSRY
jgi:hypothetical protein